MLRLRLLSIILAISFAVFGSGCSSNGIAITLDTSATTIQQGQTVNLSVSVTNDSTNSGVQWGLSGPGSLENVTSVSVVYHAPSVVSSHTTATITATSVANSSVTASVTINIDAVFEFTSISLPAATVGVAYTGTITAGGATTPFTWKLSSGTLPAGLTMTTSSDTTHVTISGMPTTVASSSFTVEVTDASGNSITEAFSITVSVPPALQVASGALPAATVGSPYTATLEAENGSMPYSWSSSNLPNWLSLNAGTGVLSGTPTATGAFSFSVTVTDSSQPTPQTATATLTVTVTNNTANNSKLNGGYAFLVNGFDSAGHFSAAGSFVADGNGHITSGTMDSNDPANLVLNQSFTGTYLINPNGLGTVTFTGTARTFALSLMSAGGGRLIEFDNTSAQASGIFLPQTPSDLSSPSISGNYVFGLIGGDPDGNRYAMGGEFAADGAGTIPSGILDADAISGPVSSASFTGTYNSPSTTTGRGTAALTVSGIGTVDCSYYMVSDSQLLMMEIDNVAGQNRRIMGGEVLAQQSPSLGAATGVLATTSLISGTLTSQNQVGLFTTDGSGNLTFTADQNSGGTLSSVSNGAGASYTVGANGRVTLSSSGIANSDPILYLVSADEAFVIGTDANVTFGFTELQTGSPFQTSSLSGIYGGGSVPLLSSGAISQVDVATADGNGSVSFVTDSSSTGTGINQNATSTGTYVVASNGRGTVTENSSETAIFYMVSPTEYWSLSTDTNATMEHFQQ